MTQTTINAEECSVQERSVSIRVLTVGTKQITQSLYQQLPYGLIVSDENYLDSDISIWGWVNLCTKHCDKYEIAHTHVIYEKDGILMHSKVDHHSYMSDDNDNKQRRLHIVKAIRSTGQLFIAVSGVWK